MIVSFDAGNVFRPWRFDPTWLTDGGWWHVDQNCLRGKIRQGKVCVQGLVTYYDATEETGGLCVIPGSHKHHTELCERSAMAKGLFDFVPIAVDDPVVQSSERILVCAKAGDLILWDSRTVHCNTPALTATRHLDNDEAKVNLDSKYGSGDAASEGSEHGAVYAMDDKTPDTIGSAIAAHIITSDPPLSGTDASTNATTESTPIPTHVDLIRLCAYVCMLPRSHATAEVLDSRKAAFVNRVRTSHWPNQLVEWVVNVPDPVEVTKCSREMLELVGYSRKDGDVRRNPKLKRIMNSGGVGGEEQNKSGCTVC